MEYFMITFSKKITLLCIILLYSSTYAMRPKEMCSKDKSYHMDLIPAKEYYIKTFGNKLAFKLVELKKMQLNGDKKGLEARKIELINILAKQWWDRSELLTEKAQIDVLLQSPITDTLSIIKNADFNVAIETLYNIKDNLHESELQAAQAILESRLADPAEHTIGEKKLSKDHSQVFNIDYEAIHDSSITTENISESQGLYSRIVDLGLRLLSVFNYNSSEIDIDDNYEGIICCKSIAFEFISPVASIVGETIGLATFDTKNYVNEFDKIPDNSLPQQATPSVSKELPERIYYESRRKELLELKQKIEIIQIGLKNACQYRNNNFVSTFLSSLNQSNIKSIVQPSIDAEFKLNDEQKRQLREIRQSDLHQIEQVIIELQHNIVFLFKELIGQKNQSFKDLCNITSEIDARSRSYNDSLDRKVNVDLNTIITSYQKYYKAEAQIDDVKEKLEELNFLIKAYQTYKNGNNISVIEKTTNIAFVIEQETKDIKAIDIFLAQAKAQIDRDKNILEENLSRYVNVPYLRNQCRQQAQQQRQDKKVSQAKQVQANRANFQPPKMPKKDDDKDKIVKKDQNKNNRPTAQRMTAKQARIEAKKLGFEETNYLSQNEPVFKKGNLYITPDRKAHNGGVWKMANSVKGLEQKTTRLGTYDANLNRIGD